MRARFLAAGLLAGLMTLPAVAADQPAGPDDVIRQTAQETLDVLQNKKEELKQHPREVYELVKKTLLPHFDFDYTARLVLGRYWRTASDEQKKEFKDVFYDYLVQTYAMGLTKYSGQDIKVFPFRGDPGDRRARIHTEVSGQDGKTVPVDFTMHKTSEGWKAYDVSIEGVSYVTNYRNEFANEIQQTSLDALIARLRKKTSEADVATPDSAQGGEGKSA